MKEAQIKTGNMLWRAQTCVSQIHFKAGRAVQLAACSPQLWLLLGALILRVVCNHADWGRVPGVGHCDSVLFNSDRSYAPQSTSWGWGS